MARAAWTKDDPVVLADLWPLFALTVKGLDDQGKGYGTEARAGLLTLAFDCLGAHSAITEVFQDNYASQRVSVKLGYRPDGISRDALGSDVVVSDRLRLTRQAWRSRSAPAATVTGFDLCRDMFGP